MKKVTLLLLVVLLFTACAPAETATESSTTTGPIVSLTPNLTEIVFALGLQDQLVGRTDYCEYPAEVSQIASIGTMLEPDIEKIISLKPGIVLTAIENPDLQAKLEEANIKVLLVPEVKTVAETYGMIENVAKAFGKEDKANEIVADMKALIEGVKESIKDAKPVSVYYVVGFGPDGDFTATGDTFIHDMLVQAGGDNVAKDSTGWSYNLESLIAADPQVIITSTEWDMKKNFVAADNYNQLTAVKENRVFEIDTDLLQIQGPRIAQGIVEIAKILHPDLVK